LIEIERWIYNNLGVDTPSDLPFTVENNINAAAMVLEAQGYTIGYDNFGTQYERMGMRKSGDPNTSVGNTIINGLCHLYCLHKQFCKTRDLDMMDVNNAIKDMDCKLAVLGDDNLGRILAEFREYVENQLKEDMLRLGLKAKSNIKTNVYDAEYCSGRMW
jgi:hypothetical protein